MPRRALVVTVRVTAWRIAVYSPSYKRPLCTFPRVAQRTGGIPERYRGVYRIPQQRMGVWTSDGDPSWGQLEDWIALGYKSESD